jgi:hypothetical protein
VFHFSSTTVYLPAMSLGFQIKKYRNALGLTLDQLAELSNVPPGTISALTVRNSVKSTYAPALAKGGFGLSLEQLLDAQTDWLPNCFDHVNSNRPTGWTPTADLLEQVAVARRAQSVAMPTPDEIKPRTTTQSSVEWPFKLVSYSRLMELRQALGSPLADEAMIDMDKQLEIVTLKWERDSAALHQEKRDAA